MPDPHQLLLFLIAAAGLSALIRASALFPALKLIGAVYLIWLGLRTIRTARNEAAAAVAQRPSLLRRCRQTSVGLFIALGAATLLARRPT